jgi:hypothetical protein
MFYVSHALNLITCAIDGLASPVVRGGQPGDSDDNTQQPEQAAY